MKKRIIAILLLIMVCFTTLLSPLSVYADDDYPYVKDGTDEDGSSYYIVEGREVKDLFNFVITDVFTKPWEVLQWVFTFKTFVVLKEYNYDNTTYIKGYWNTPNLQMLARNLITSEISDGYTDDTYNVTDTQWIVDVGDNATKVNAITKYGFKLPNYTYTGEFPKEYMSVHNILPTSFWDVIIRFFKSLFGLSFINPPDASNYKTITYWNHEYTDKEEYLIQFFQNYYYKYFYSVLEAEDVSDANSGVFENKNYTYKKLSGHTYKDHGAQDFLEQFVTQEMVNAAYAQFQNTKITVPEAQIALLDAAINAYNEMRGTSLETTISRTALFKLFGIEFGTAKPIKGTTDQYDGIGAYNLVSAMHDIVDEMEDKRYTFWYAYTHPEILLSDNSMSYKDYFENVVYRPYHISLINSAMGYDGLSKETAKIPTTLNFSSSFLRDGTPYTRTWDQDYEITETTEPDPNDSTKTITVKHYTRIYSDRIIYCLFENSNGNSLVTCEPSASTMRDLGLPESFAENLTPRRILELNATYETDPDSETGYVEVPIDTPAEPDSEAELWEAQKAAFFANCEAIINNYDAYRTCESKWKSFEEKFNAGKDNNKKVIHYNQCLIENEGEDKECWTTAHSEQKTTIAVGIIYATGGMYKAVDMSKYNSTNYKLDHSDAVKLIQCIQSYCGPYYSTVMSNLLITMEQCAKAHGVTLEMDQFTDFRVMPYDTNSMISSDKQNFTVADPRVEIYRETLLGSLVADLTLRINLNMAPQKGLLDFAGKITELSVVFQHFINFDLLDSWGLSPTNLWTNAFVLIAICALVVFFLFKTVKAVWDLVHTGAGNRGKIVVAFILLILEVGMFTAVMWAPQQVWGTIKNASTKIINIGEDMITDDKTIAYLFGEDDNKDPATLYYLPYLDAWSQYNTGYGLFAPEQLITNADDKPETMGLTHGANWESNWPKIGNQRIQHWSVLLLDSFEYSGSSTSIHSVQKNGELVNGKIINHNAYRVVDHFLAPRITIESAGSNKKVISTAQNENYNGSFQSGIINLIPKLMAVVLMMFISLIKLLTFIWFWYMLYIFIFQSVLSKVSGKSWKEILAQTFMPLVYMVFIGIYAGLVVKINGLTEGLMAILIQLFMYGLTIVLIRYWSRTQYFPKTVKPIAMLCDLKQTKNRWEAKKYNTESASTAASVGVKITEEEMQAPDKYREKLFNDDGTMRAEYKGDRYKGLYEDWARYHEKRLEMGIQPSAADRRALQEFNKANPGQQYNLDTFKHGDSHDERGKTEQSKKNIDDDLEIADDTIPTDSGKKNNKIRKKDGE